MVAPCIACVHQPPLRAPPSPNPKPCAGPGSLPAAVVAAAAAAAADGSALLGSASAAHEAHGLIAVSSSASLASSAAGGGGAPSSAGGGDYNKTLYLGNLHPFVTEATLQEVFAGLGGITELKVGRLIRKVTWLVVWVGGACRAGTPCRAGTAGRAHLRPPP